MASRKFLGLAMLLYLIFSLALIMARPGLQYDEALTVLSAVHMRHSAAEMHLPHDPDTWACVAGRCFPLMNMRYVGAFKEYVSLPAFAIFGPRTPLIRLIAVLLSVVCIWGIGRFVGRYATPAAGITAAFLLALNPAFVDQTVFDNGAIATWMLALGFLLTAAAAYWEKPRTWAAAAAGFGVGLGVWSRANFAWLVVAAAIGFAPLLWQWVRAARRHALAAAAGAICGSAPFLLYQALSGFGTLQATGMFHAESSGLQLLARRSVMWAESLIVDREHRAIWNGPQQLDWYYWSVPVLAVAALLVCLGTRLRHIAVTALVFYAFLFSSRLPVAEHHFVTALPLIAAATAIAAVSLAARFPKSKYALFALGGLYAVTAISWQGRAAAGIRATGGAGEWSDAVLDVARELDRNYPGRHINIVDWGLQNNLYVLTGGRLLSHEIYPRAQASPEPERFWEQEFKRGGIFLANGKENERVKDVAAAFRRQIQLYGLRPVKVFPERSGRVYAELYDIAPGTTPAREADPARAGKPLISLADPSLESRLTGFHQIEQNSYRWTSRRFSITLDAPAGPALLVLELYLPEDVFRRQGPVTLHASAGQRRLAPQTFSAAGKLRYERPVPASGTPVTIQFELDKSFTMPGDDRDLGIIVSSAGLAAAR